MKWSITDIEYLAGVFGLGSTFLSTIQFLPQIYKTYINKVRIIIIIIIGLL